MARIITSGMWVDTTVGTGIYIVETVAVKADGSRRLAHGAAEPQEGETIEKEAWVHLVNTDGSTLTQLPAANCGNIQQAALASIPEPRRPTPEVGARFGYL